MFTEDLCIVVQGPSNYVDQVKSAWKYYSNQLVFCTWKGNESKYTDSDNVIFLNPPHDCGVSNLNLQVLSTLAGIEYAKSMGFNRVLKIRSDMIPTNATAFAEQLSLDRFEIFSSIHDYYTDYFMCGYVSDMEAIWNINLDDDYEFPEQPITRNIIDICGDMISFYIDKMDEQNEVYWLKYDKNLKQTWNGDTARILTLKKETKA
jgi:hypothetical protein